jgi:murein DD-endopeptidase MepM/ murein hydrolase activator NlpD
MALTCSVPATAVTPEVTGVAAVARSLATAPAAQSLQVGSGPLAVVERDGYTVTDPPKPEPVAAAPASTSGAAALGSDVAPAASGTLLWPVPIGRMSGGYGPRDAPCAGCSTFHKGADLTPGEGTPIHAIADGVVREVSASDNGGLGVYAVIDHVINGEHVASTYGHMVSGSLQVSAGQAVTAGQILGSVGNTGQSTGAHLHFEILLDGTTPTDPMAWMTSHGAV